MVSQTVQATSRSYHCSKGSSKVVSQSTNQSLSTCYPVLLYLLDVYAELAVVLAAESDHGEPQALALGLNIREGVRRNNNFTKKA